MDYRQQMPSQFPGQMMSPQHFPGFPGGGDFGLNQRVNQLERQVQRLEREFDRLNRRVSRLENQSSPGFPGFPGFPGQTSFPGRPEEQGYY